MRRMTMTTTALALAAVAGAGAAPALGAQASAGEQGAYGALFRTPLGALPPLVPAAARPAPPGFGVSAAWQGLALGR
jgi:hypothetical protein